MELGISRYNQLVKEGYLGTASGKVTVLRPITTSVIESVIGGGTVQPNWVSVGSGCYIDALSESQTQELEGALWMGDGGAALIAAILGASGIGAGLAVVVAAILTIGAGYIQYEDGQGGNQGVIIWFCEPADVWVTPL